MKEQIKEGHYRLLTKEVGASNRSTNAKAARLQPTTKAFASVLLGAVECGTVHNKMYKIKRVFCKVKVFFN